VLRLVACSFTVACILAQPGEAIADGGPVFTVLPNGGASLSRAIHRQLDTDRRALSATLKKRGADAALLRRAQAEAAAAADPFPAQDRADRLTQTVAADAARASRLRHAIHGLELALQPAAPPADLSSRSSTAIGAYAVSIAERYLGVRYVWGGGDPDSGFDCSGFVRFAYAQLGILLPHYAASQYATTVHVDPSSLQPGDLVFFEPRADGPGHVGIYVGNDVFIEAPHTGDVVKFARLSAEARELGFVGASRPAA